MTNEKIKKYVIPNLPYLFIFILFCNVGEAYRVSDGRNILFRCVNTLQNVGEALHNPFPSLNLTDWAFGVIGAVAVYLIVQYRRKNQKKWRQNIEYGSARWGNKTDIEPFVAEKFEDNVILTATESLMLKGRPKDPKFARNKNVLIVGGSGAGKTRFWLKPNLMQMHSSYCITDPKGSIVIECGKLLQRNGYNIKILNTIDFKKSMHYNPFEYIRSEKDILKFVTALISNTKGEGSSGDPFWVKAETLLYCALIGYIHYEAPYEEKNINTLVEMINAMETREDDENFKNAVDYMFDDLEFGIEADGTKAQPEHFAVRQYRKYKLAAGLV